MAEQGSATLPHEGDRTTDRGPRGRLAVVMFTVCGNLYLFVASALLGAAAAVSGWIPPRRYWPGQCARLWARGLLLSSGVRLHVEGTEQVDRAAAYVVMPNHTSTMDIPVLIASFPGALCFVAKRELFRIPLFGWGMRAAGFIPVDRSDRSRASAVVQAASERLAHGDSVVVFPEETRSPDGRLLPFQRGGFLMAIRARRSVLPVGIRGSRDVRHKRGIVVRPGVVEVIYGEPVDVAGHGVRHKGEVMSQVRQTIGRLAAVELSGSAPSPSSLSARTSV